MYFCNLLLNVGMVVISNVFKIQNSIPPNFMLNFMMQSSVLGYLLIGCFFIDLHYFYIVAKPSCTFYNVKCLIFNSFSNSNMELAHSLLLNEAALKTVPENKQDVFIYEWLRFLKKVLKASQKVRIFISDQKDDRKCGHCDLISSNLKHFVLFYDSSYLFCNCAF